MAKNKRKEKARSLKQPPPQQSISQNQRKIGKILILVEGGTEKIYFEGLIKGVASYLGVSRLKADIYAEPSGDLRTMIQQAMRQRNDYEKIWLVVDNDKRNAFILGNKSGAIMPELLKRWKVLLPTKIIDDLTASWDAPKHAYFLSEHDYLQWVIGAIRDKQAQKHWYAIKESTPKNKTFEEYEEANPYILFKNSDLFKDKTKGFWNVRHSNIKKWDVLWKNYTELAYSCIAFEYWLLLHFEQNKTPFLWVEHSKGVDFDVYDYFTSNYSTHYEKGGELDTNDNLKKEKNHAYTCLAPIKGVYIDKIDKENHQKALWKIINAYRNIRWLQNEMRDELMTKADKWYEVNPYIKGYDTLLKQLLHLEEQGQTFDYDGCTLCFEYDYANQVLRLEVTNKEDLPILINKHHRDCFVIITADLNEFLPTEIPATEASPNSTKKIGIQYNNIPSEINGGLVLKLRDPRQNSRTELKLILL